jgi:hypothetical protein
VLSTHYYELKSLRFSASFAAMVLESHDVTASLEASVRLRTSQLEQALAHRAQFTSSITHEVSILLSVRFPEHVLTDLEGHPVTYPVTFDQVSDCFQLLMTCHLLT